MNSIRAVPVSAAEAPATTRHAHLLRARLRADEMAASITFEIALRMPNFAELQARLARGEQIPPREMAARYYPSASDYRAVVAWIEAQGLTVTRTDANRLAVFGRGSVSAVAAAFQVSFGRVGADDAEYTSALTAPSLPAAVATSVLGIHGLQPQLRLRRSIARIAHPASGGGGGAGYTPAQIAAHYSAAAAGLTGSGQTIGIFSGAYADNADLQDFWNAIGVVNPPTIQQVNVGGGPAASDTNNRQEAALDEEWAGGLAPGATIRVYGADDTDPNFADEIFQQIAADLPNIPSLHVLSISYNFDETALDYDYVMILSQYCANLASAGVTILNASGDQGSNEGGKLQVSSPTSDPNVTGVGGTTYTGNAETGWSGSGGGVSVVFSRPPWQAGTGVPAGTMRLCPDVAAAADPNEGALIFFQGQQEEVGGTSWATPIWAAFCAMIDQYRANQGSGPIGNVNTRIYALIGTQALSDMTAGNNGAYACGVGYDMVTGVGVPNLQALCGASLTPPSSPVIYSQFGAVNVTVGVPATFYIVATGAATMAYQWQRQAVGSSGWASLTDNGSYQGSATPMLRVLNPGSTGAMNGDQFECIVTNSQGTATSAPEILVVNPFGVSTLAGWPGAWGTADGTGLGARFESPGGIRGDGAGNLYVADGSANTIRKVTAEGVVTTVVGLPGMAGNTNGLPSVATLNDPSGVAVNAAGKLFIADDGNQCIREFVGGVLITYATGFEDPQDVACDTAGNLYVADASANVIRKVSVGGAVSVLAGSGAPGSADGLGPAASFDNPDGLAVDASGNVYVSDNKNGAVRVVSPQGAVTTLARGLSSPTGVSVDTSGNVYVACQGDCTIRLVTSAGVVSLLAGSPNVSATTDGTPLAARFADPTQVYWDPSTDMIYVADFNDVLLQGGENVGGTVRTLAAPIGAAPVITTQPGPSQTIAASYNASFTVTASGAPPLTYQWQVEAPNASIWSNLSDGPGYAGSATRTLDIVNAASAVSGSSYRCEVSDPEGSADSAVVTLTVYGPPVVQVTPGQDFVPPGGSVTLYTDATGVGALSYQWYTAGLDSLTAIPGATGSTYTISNFTTADEGTYEVVVTDAYGYTTAAISTVLETTSRLANLSTLSQTASGSGVLTAGFVVGGIGSKNLLLRAPGPGLAEFGVDNPLADPILALFDANSSPIASNAGWQDSAALSADFTATGAFPFASNSADAAMAQDLPVGLYSMTVAGASGDEGMAMLEIYNMDPASSPARLVNISARAYVSSTSTLSAGFVIVGGGGETVLVRGIGPALGQFGISDPLAHPVLTIYDKYQDVLQSSAGWGGTLTLSNTFMEVGAFALPAASADAAIRIILSPGSYTAQVTSGDGTAGVALVEVYEVP